MKPFSWCTSTDCCRALDSLNSGIYIIKACVYLYVCGDAANAAYG